MDNLTHSLIGAVLGQAGLKRKTGLAMPALIIAANLPDIDAPCTFYGTQSLAMRRGITHGPIALVVLPLLLAGGLILYDRWQARRGKRPESRAPVNPGWLVALCYIGTLTHPAFDWLNSYGIRLLEPFSSQWFYGDALFIIDPWLLAMLGGGLWLSRRSERAHAARWAQPARVAIAMALAYVAINIAISRHAAWDAAMHEPYPMQVVANPVPLAFWRREIHLRSGDTYAAADYSLFGSRRSAGELKGRPTNMSDPRIAERVQRSADARAFLFWSRMPVAENSGDNIVLKDQRFLQIPARSPFTVILPPD